MWQISLRYQNMRSIIHKFVFVSAMSIIALNAESRRAFANNAVVVAIECTHPTKAKSLGSGVVVSNDGHVVTAKHVIASDDYECWGFVENNTKDKRRMVEAVHGLSLNENIDGKLLRFIPSDGETFEFATYCELAPELVQHQIFAKGFHRESFGVPSVTSGVISNGFLTKDGIVETDALTVSGKSGGPVFLDGSDSIIGIIAGAKFEPTGLPTYYGVVAAEVLAQVFQVMTPSTNCPGFMPTASKTVENQNFCESRLVQTNQSICELSGRIDQMISRFGSAQSTSDLTIRLPSEHFESGQFIFAELEIPSEVQSGFLWAALLIEDAGNGDLVLPLLPIHEPSQLRDWGQGSVVNIRRNIAPTGLLSLLKAESDSDRGLYWAYEVDPTNRIGQIFVIHSKNVFLPPSGKDAVDPAKFLSSFEEALETAVVHSIATKTFNLN